MKRTGRGIPAAAVLANGLSRHGAHCHCRICVDVRAEERGEPDRPWSSNPAIIEPHWPSQRRGDR